MLIGLDEGLGDGGLGMASVDVFAMLKNRRVLVRRSPPLRGNVRLRSSTRRFSGQSAYPNHLDSARQG